MMGGRQRMRYQGGERQLELLESQRGETDLAYIGGEFYLLATCEVEEPEVKKVAGYLGVDLGIVNLATDSARACLWRWSGEWIEKEACEIAWQASVEGYEVSSSIVEKTKPRTALCSGRESLHR